MILIKGNLILREVRQAQNRISSETSSEQIRDPKDIVAYADLTQYDTTYATIIDGDAELTYEDLDELTLVLKEVVEVESW